MNILKPKWQTRFLNLAQEIATWSKDQSTRTGALILTDEGIPVSFGYNGFPRGVDDTLPERHERPQKYDWFEHAERNAIYQSQSLLKGTTIFCTHCPCPACARAIIQSGIKRVIYDTRNQEHGEGSMFEEDFFSISLTMFEESGVEIIAFSVVE